MAQFRPQLHADLPAALVVFLVALPLCLGIAMGSGAPLLSGIIAGVVGGIVVGLLSGSSISVSGPAAGLTAVVFTAISDLGSFEVFLVSVVLAGMFQVFMGLLRLGIVGHYVPNTVTKGMMAAIGIILIIKQIPYLTGYNLDLGEPDGGRSGLDHTLLAIKHSLGAMNPAAMAIGLSALAWLQLSDAIGYGKTKLGRILPSALVAVVGGGFMVPLLALFGGSAWSLPTELYVLLPKLNANTLLTPRWDSIGQPAVWLTAMSIALIASLESLLSVEAADRLDGLKRVTPKNKELMAQGAGNLVSGFLGGLPITSVVVRSSVNAQAGAQTRWSTVLHAVILGLSVVLLTPWLNRIPLATLAAVLIATGYKLAHPKKVIATLVRQGLMQWVPFTVTVIAILATDLLQGIAIGLFVAVLFVVAHKFRGSVRLTNHEDHYVLELQHDISFLHKHKLKESLEQVPEGKQLTLDLRKANFIDPDIVELIDTFREQCSSKGTKISIEGATEQRKRFAP